MLDLQDFVYIPVEKYLVSQKEVVLKKNTENASECSGKKKKIGMGTGRKQGERR